MKKRIKKLDFDSIEVDLPKNFNALREQNKTQIKILDNNE